MTGPSHEPLDEQERELARILRALPGGEPSAALDQRILRAAADASASAPARRRASHWLAFGGAGWGIGGAAAAVLALGVGWHLLDPARNLPMERTSPAEAPAQDESPVTVELGELLAPAAAPAAAPASPAAQPAPAAAQPAPARRQSLPAPPPAPAPAPPPPAVAEVEAQGINAIDVASVESTTILSAEQIAKVAEDDRARELRQEDSARAQSSAAAARDTAAQPAAAPAAKASMADAAAPPTGAMTPARWLAQVRSLRDANRRAEAADSLRRFHQYYPQYAIPADLLPLMRE